MAEPNAAVQIEKRNNVVMKGLGSTMPSWNTESLNEHFFHHLQIKTLVRKNQNRDIAN
jgi:hypothetical protein